MGSEFNSTGSGQGSLMASCEHGNKLTGFIKDGGYLDHLTNYQLFKRVSAPWRDGMSELVSEADKLRNY
jgi:hypothetical protein